MKNFKNYNAGNERYANNTTKKQNETAVQCSG